MTVSGRRIRPLLTIVWVVLGAIVGGLSEKAYLTYLGRVLDGKTTDILGIVPQSPTRLSQADKMWLLIVFVVVGALLGFILEFLAFQQFHKGRTRWEEMTPQEKIALIAGLMIGLVFSVLLRTILALPDWVNIPVAILLCYVCVVGLQSMNEQIRFYFPGSMPATKGHISLNSRPKILDTNVIIDGRIADIARAGFVEGPVYVPKFVLEELQQIADSSDSLKRARGRRGLDILNQMQKEMELHIPEFSSVDPNDEVDARLVVAAREVSGAIVTNDYNLNRVAELQGVDVLNINELANALKPVVLPGEEMRVTIIREGKEKDQGIGYLDDGTMIVVEGARRLIGETLDVNVTSVLQTSAGRMVFTKLKEGLSSNGS